MKRSFKKPILKITNPLNSVQDDRENFHENQEKRVKFDNENLETIKLISSSKDENDHRSTDLNTLDDLLAENQTLIEELHNLKNKAMEGDDVTKKLDQIQNKLRIIIDIGVMISKNKNKQITSIDVDSKEEKSPLPDDQSFDFESLSKPLTIPDAITKRLIRPKFEICLCLDNRNPLLTHLFKIIGKLREKNVHVAFVLWISRNQIRKTNFVKITPDISEQSFPFRTSEFKDVRKEILSLKWSADSLKVFVYFKSIFDTVSNIFPLNSDDQLDIMLTYEQIHRNKIFLSNIDEDSINRQLESLESIISRLKSLYFYEDLNNLKRCIVDSQRSLDSFFKRSKCLMMNSLYPSGSIYFKYNYTKDEWNQHDVSLTNETQQIELYKICSMNFVSNYSRSILAPMEDSATNEHIHLEKLILDYDSRPRLEIIYCKMIDIFLTTKKIADAFNSCVKVISITVPDASLIKLDESDYESAELALIAAGDFPTTLTSDWEEPQGKYRLDAFTHFSYEYTKRELLIIDLKTRFDSEKNETTLFEPVIFSKSRNYGCSDLGLGGIDWFMSTHKCNYCKYWNDKLNS